MVRPPPPLPLTQQDPKSSEVSTRKKLVLEVLKTERDYIADLGAMQVLPQLLPTLLPLIPSAPL